MSNIIAKFIRKTMKPTGHVGPRRWIKFVERNFEPAFKIHRPERYLHSSARLRAAAARVSPMGGS